MSTKNLLWLDENAPKYNGSISYRLLPMRPDEGPIIKVNGVDIPEDVFPEEFKVINKALNDVLDKMNEHKIIFDRHQRILFSNDEEFSYYIENHRPLEIWWDEFSLERPYIKFRGYNKTSVTTLIQDDDVNKFYPNELKYNNLYDIYQDGLYVKIRN
jgi:hypothetical protein